MKYPYTFLILIVLWLANMLIPALYIVRHAGLKSQLSTYVVKNGNQILICILILTLVNINQNFAEFVTPLLLIISSLLSIYQLYTFLNIFIRIVISNIKKNGCSKTQYMLLSSCLLSLLACCVITYHMFFCYIHFEN